MNDAEFLHTLTPVESDALEDMGEPGSHPAGALIFEQGRAADLRGFLIDHPRAAITRLELISRRLREAEAKRLGG